MSKMAQMVPMKDEYALYQTAKSQMTLSDLTHPKLQLFYVLGLQILHTGMRYQVLVLIWQTPQMNVVEVT